MPITMTPSELAMSIRRVILDQSKRANVGHIGSCLSVADIIAALYIGPLSMADPRNSERNRMVLSKGHAALAVYAALHLTGRLSLEQLETFCGDDSMLGVHPEHHLAGIDFSTGSLGQGLSIAIGSAYAARMRQSSRRVYVVLSDAECNEGSVWEGAMFAAHHKLDNLVVVIDLNGQQALGYTEEILSMDPVAAKWRAFKWRVTEVDGHDAEGLVNAFADASEDPGQPHLLLARTTFGKGVSFMERQVPWHYLPLSDEQFHQAVAEISSS